MNADAHILERIEIKYSTQVSEDRLGDFYEAIFPNRAEFLKKNWRWIYRVDDFPEVRPPLVAVLDGKVIGQVAQIPVIVKGGGQEKLAAWGVDYAVLPAYRKSGIGYQITLAWMELYPIYLVFCTEASFRIVMKQGWEPRLSTYDLRLPLRPDRYERFQKGFYRFPARVGGGGWNLCVRIATLARTSGWKKLRNAPLSGQRLENWSLLRHPREIEEPLHVARSEEYLRWRVLECPFRQQYHILETRDANLAAFLRTFRNGSLTCTRVLSISGEAESEGILYRFLGSLVRWAAEHDVDLINMVTSDPLLVRMAHRWFPLKTRLRFASFSNDSQGAEMLRGRPHRWELMDSDFDFLT